MCSAYIETLPDKKIPYILLVTKIFIKNFLKYQ